MMKPEELRKEVDAMDSLDSLLSLRESRTNSMRNLNQMIVQGLKQYGFPRRWYVRNPPERVMEYLDAKYPSPTPYWPDCGYGEMHGERAFIPHDTSYSWEITPEEFDIAKASCK